MSQQRPGKVADYYWHHLNDIELSDPTGSAHVGTLDPDRVLNPQRRLTTGDLKYQFYMHGDDEVWKSSCFHSEGAGSWWSANFK